MAENMETDTGIPDEPPADAAPRQPLSFNLLKLIKAAQAQHGLRHSDYTRYR